MYICLIMLTYEVRVRNLQPAELRSNMENLQYLIRKFLTPWGLSDSNFRPGHRQFTYWYKIPAVAHHQFFFFESDFLSSVVSSKGLCFVLRFPGFSRLSVSCEQYWNEDDCDTLVGWLHRKQKYSENIFSNYYIFHHKSLMDCPRIKPATQGWEAGDLLVEPLHGLSELIAISDLYNNRICALP